ALAVADGRPGRAGEVDGERLVPLGQHVPENGDIDGFGRLARGEREGAAAGGVIAPRRGGAVGGGPADRDRLAARGRQRHGEGGGGRAGVPFRHRDVVDAEPGRRRRV